MKVTIGYWIREWRTFQSSNYVIYVRYDGYYNSDEDGYSSSYAIRPLVTLPADITGTVGEEVTIDYWL